VFVGEGFPLVVFIALHTTILMYSWHLLTGRTDREKGDFPLLIVSGPRFRNQEGGGWTMRAAKVAHRRPLVSR
jgi:hypothetical protein